jgi:hypothetical protein
MTLDTKLLFLVTTTFETARLGTKLFLEGWCNEHEELGVWRWSRQRPTAAALRLATQVDNARTRRNEAWLAINLIEVSMPQTWVLRRFVRGRDETIVGLAFGLFDRSSKTSLSTKDSLA